MSSYLVSPLPVPVPTDAEDPGYVTLTQLQVISSFSLSPMWATIPILPLPWPSLPSLPALTVKSLVMPDCKL